MTPDLWAAAGIIFGFLTILALAEISRKFWHLSPESSRKIVHVGGGLLTLPLPWLVSSPYVVMGLAAASSLLLFAGRKLKTLKSIHSVDRRTGGSEYFPLAIALLFILSLDQKWLYLASMLVLAVADAGAALIGSRHGRLRYWVEDDAKSVEGSLAFLLLAWPAILLPSLLLTDLPLPILLPGTLIVALLVTGFEAISTGGTDNLFVPIGVCVILPKISAQPVEEIHYQLFSLLAMFLLGGGLAWRTRTFHAGGAMAILMFCYGAWTLASEHWAAAPLAGFVAYALGRRLLPARPEREQPVRVIIVFRTVVTALLLLIIANMHHLHEPLAPAFAMAVTAAILQSLWNHWQDRQPGHPLLEILYILLALLTLAAPLAILHAATLPHLLPLALLFAANELYRRQKQTPPPAWGAFQLSLTLLATVPAILL
ncbi:MAG: hypothetical protein JJU29_06175 [Verrucomicrobia bacterium]|nr:hypothetical protein [Verrucomicrobiota bacterium]